MVTDESKKLLTAVGAYTEGLKDKDKTVPAVREINRFVKHFRGETDFSSITPSQIGTYAEEACKNGSSSEAIEGLQAVRKFLTYAFKENRTTVNLATHFRIRKSKISSSSKIEDGSAYGSGQEMTPDGYEQLVSEKDSLESNRVRISETIHTAASDGDVRENAPLEAAREQQGREESRIKEIDSMLRTAIIVDASGRGTEKVRIGTTIQIENLERKKKFKYTLVSPSEANPLEGKISDASPLGKAFIGKRVGQRASAETPKGTSNFKILNIS